jgi:pimeloyl-ACP methyl ester carboxylesterase
VYHTRIVTHADSPVRQHLVHVDGVVLEIYDAEAPAGGPVVCAAHPADAYVSETARLLRRLSGARVVCVNARGLGNSSPGNPDSIESMVTDIDRVRTWLGLESWVFWGVSGGGWLAQSYARAFPGATRGLVLESSCACLRERVSDPGCIMSPRHPAWRTALAERGLLQLEPSPSGAGVRTNLHVGETSTGNWVAIAGVGNVLLDSEQLATLVLPEGLPASERLRRVQVTFLEFDSRAWLSALRTPALVLAGTEDPVAPLSHSRALHLRLQQSSFVAIEGAGHNPAVQGLSAAVEPLRRFLNEL